MVEKINPLLATVQQTSDPVDTVDIKDIEFSPNENPLEVSYKQSADKEPERIAATIKTARSLNQPPEVVDQNFDAATKAAERPSSEYFADIIKDNPRVAKFLSDPQAMGVAKDDIPSLINFDDTVKSSLHRLNPANFPGASPDDYKKMSSDIVSGWKSGRLNVRQSQIGWQRLMETMQTGEWSQYGSEDLAAIENESQAQPQPPKGFAPFYFAGQQLPNFALMAERGVIRAGQVGLVAAGGAAALSAMTGPGVVPVGAVTVPAATLSGLSLGGRIGVAEASAILEGGAAFDEFSKIRDVNGKQIDPKQAAQMALAVGIVNAGLEYVSAAALLRTIPGGDKVLGMIGNKSIFKKLTPGIAIREAAKTYLESIGTEIATEMAQETTVVEGGNLLKQLSGEPFEPTPPGSQIARILSVVSPTAQATALMGIPGSTIHIVTDIQSMSRATKSQEVYAELQNQASKLRERDPVMAEAHMADVTKGTPVENIYVDARAAERYFQSQNMDMNEVAAELGVSDQLPLALERGGDLVLPYAAFNAKLGATDHYVALANDVKFDPNERTVNQANAKATETANLLVQQAQNVAQADPLVAQGMDFIYNDIKGKMEQSGAYKQDKSGQALMDANAKVFAAAIVNLPERGARDPKEFYLSMLPVEVQSAEAAPSEALQQTVAEMPKSEEFNKWFGKSKVVDDKGAPLVVYHGSTSAKQIGKFKTPAYFTNEPSFAEMFASEREAGSGPVYPVFLNMSNPLVIDGAVEGRHFEWDAADVKRMKAEGYDGVVVKGGPDESDIYTVFDPNQIKSAIGNSGAFNSKNQSILHQGPLTVAPTLEAGIDRVKRAEQIQRRARLQIAQVSWESRPGRLTGILPESNDAPYAQQLELHNAIMSALQGPNKENLLANAMGLQSLGDFQGPGVYQGEVSPGSQSEITATSKSRRIVDKKSRDAISAYAAIMGSLLKQEAMAWHRPFYVTDVKNANGIELVTGKPIIAENAKALYNALAPKLTEIGITPDDVGIIPAPDGVRVISFAKVDTTKFHAAVEQAFEESQGNEKAAAYYFGTDGEYLSNDWKENPNGESYITRANEAGYGEAVAYANRVLAPKIRSVHEAFAAKYGWTNPYGKEGIGPEAAARYEQARLAAANSKQLNSPAFKSWFGNSVITTDGKPGSPPQVMFHGTDKNFDVFKTPRDEFSGSFDDLGMHVGTFTQANDRIAYKSYLEGTIMEGANVKPLFVKMDNPLELHDIGDWGNIPEIQDALRRVASLEPYMDRINKLNSIGAVRKFLKERGYDGIKYLNEWESGRGQARFENLLNMPNWMRPSAEEILTEEIQDAEYSYIVFKPEQLKSATGNIGTFDPKQHSILLQGTPDEPRGFIEFGEKKTLIGLLKADASTFVHETAHFWLNNFAAFVDSGRATEKHLADWKVLSDWLKIEDGTTKLSVEQQEKFARGFEAYLREGVAPSEGLRTAFRRFARWLTKLYRDIRQLNVDLTDDVRGVMDRMLASEDEIAFARRHMGLDLIPDLKGIDPSVIAKLTDLREEAHAQAVEDLLKKQMRELTPERRDQYRIALERAKKAATEEVMQEPIYLAAESIKRSGMKLKDANEAAIAYLEKRMSQEDRISFRMTAEMNGFDGGQKLAKKLLESPTAEQEINRRVQFAMQDYADLKDTDKIKEEAVRALANERQTELLSYERAMFLALVDQAQNNAKEIRTRRADAKIEADAAKAKASEIISKTPVNKAISFMPYFTAERNAATEAYVKAKAGDFMGAAEAKQRQMLNHALATEAFRARQSIERWRGYLHDLQLKERALFKREEHFNQVAALLARFEIERKDYDPAKRTETLAAWSTRMIEQESPVNLAPWLLDESTSKPWKDLTVSEMRDFVDGLKNIQHVANKENTFYRVMQGATIENTVLDLAKEAAANNVANPPEQIERRTGFLESAKKTLRGYDSILKTAENIAMKMDGWKDNGPWVKALWRPAEVAGNAESELLRPFAEKYKAILEKHYTEQERAEMVDDDEKIFIPEFNQSARRISLIMMAMNTGTESNRARLFETHIVGVDPSIAWGEQEVMGVLQKYLTANDWRFVQDVWNMINGLWPQMAEVHKEVTGFSPEKVDAQSFRVTTPDGQQIFMDGGYFPLKADTRANLRTEIQEQLDQPLYTELNPAFVASTKTGHLQSRVAQAKYPVALEVSIIQRHIQDAVHDIAWRPTIIDLRRLVNNNGFRETMLKFASAEDYSALRDWVGSAASGNAKEQMVLSWWDRMLRTLKSNFTASVIVLNPKIVTQNVSNLFLYAGSAEGFGWKDVVSGMSQKGLPYILGSLTRAKSAEASRQFVYEKSSFMLDKHNSADASLNDVADAMFGKQHTIRNFFKGAMSAFDELTSIPMWRTAYEKGLATGKSEAESIEFADTVIRRSIGAARKYQTAGIFRSGETAKTFATLYGFMSAQRNRWEKERGILGKDYIGNSPQFLGYIFSHFVLFAAMSQIMSGNVPEFDDEDKLKRWLKGVALYPLQMLPAIGQMANVVADNALGLQSFGYRPLPQVAIPEKAMLAIAKTISAARGNAEPKDAVEAISHALTYTTGTPDQLANWFWNIFDIAVEGMEPTPGDLLKRRPARER